jgi:hypothetical protein
MKVKGHGLLGPYEFETTDAPSWTVSTPVKGWICPGCTRVWNPFIEQCQFCGPDKPRVETEGAEK